MSKAQELKSILGHPGWKHIEEFILNSQAMRFNEISAKATPTEDILKGVGAIESYRKLMGWVQSSSQEQDSEV